MLKVLQYTSDAKPSNLGSKDSRHRSKMRPISVSTSGNGDTELRVKGGHTDA